MKIYIKDGAIKSANRIVVKNDEYQIFNPTEEMILADGWVEYAPGSYEPTEEEILNREKEFKIE